PPRRTPPCRNPPGSRRKQVSLHKAPHPHIRSGIKAAKRRKSAAHGASRGLQRKLGKAPKGRNIRSTGRASPHLNRLALQRRRHLAYNNFVSGEAMKSFTVFLALFVF